MLENQLKSEKTLLLKTIELIPLFGTALVIMGAGRLMGYYNFFHIPIMHFLDFSEIITSFLDVLTMGGLVIMSGLLGLIKGVRHTSKTFAENDLRTTLTTARKKHRNFLIRNAIMILVVTAGTGVMYLFNLIPAVVFWVLVIIDVCAALFFALMDYEDNIADTLKSLNPLLRFVIKISFITFIMFYIFYLVGFGEGFFTKQTHFYEDVSVFFNDNKTMNSDSNNYYIGNTRNYLFYYHEATKASDIIPMSRVNQIQFRVNDK